MHLSISIAYDASPLYSGLVDGRSTSVNVCSLGSISPPHGVMAWSAEVCYAFSLSNIWGMLAIADRIPPFVRVPFVSKKNYEIVIIIEL